MTARPPRTKPKKEDPTEPKGTPGPTEAPADALAARTVLRPTVQAGVTIRDYAKAFGEVPLRGLVDELVEQCDMANGGDLTRAESILTAQAHTLDAVFNTLARRSEQAKRMSYFESYLRLGLKAQAQCRATLETLAAIKNPAPVAFVRQANIAHGPQQVNNAGDGAGFPSKSRAHAHARAGNSENPQNKVLEHRHGERLDFGATGTAGSTDSRLEAVGALHRPEDSGR